MSKIWIVVPTYNEAENIGEFISALSALGTPHSVLVVDDNSPDGTGRIVEDLRKKYPNLYLLSRPRKAGLGSAYVAGFWYVLEELDPPSHKASDFVKTPTDGSEGSTNMLFVEIDADGSHQIADLQTLISLISADNADIDVVVGSRFVKGGSLDYPLHRKLLSWAANVFANLVLGLGVKDATSGFKVYKRPVVESFLEDGFSSSGYSFQVETLLRAKKKGFKIKEVPITFIDRKRGASKMGFREIWRGALAVLKLKIEMMRKSEKPRNWQTVN